MFTNDVKAFHAELIAEPMFKKLLEQIELTGVSVWSPGKQVSEPEHAFECGVVRGEENILSILKGEI